MDDARSAPTIVPPKKPRGRNGGRRLGSKNSVAGMPRYGARKDFVLVDEMTGPRRFFTKMVADIIKDLGGTRELSRIEAELIRAFCGAATILQTMNANIALGEMVNVGDYSNLASAMMRLSSRLGIKRRPTDITPSLDEFLDDINKNRRSNDAEAIEVQEAGNVGLANDAS